MKKFAVVLHTENKKYEIHTNSWKLAKWIADLKCWKDAKIHAIKEIVNDDPWNKCIYVKGLES